MLAMQIAIEGYDLAILIIYLVGIVGLGCWAGFRQRRGAEGKNYFLAGGTLRWPIIGLALFSTNISTIHLVSLAQEGYENGLAYGNFEWMAANHGVPARANPCMSPQYVV
jgi:SSS family solute:Na+ symporter